LSLSLSLSLSCLLTSNIRSDVIQFVVDDKRDQVRGLGLYNVILDEPNLYTRTIDELRELFRKEVNKHATPAIFMEEGSVGVALTYNNRTSLIKGRLNKLLAKEEFPNGVLRGVIDVLVLPSYQKKINIEVAGGKMYLIEYGPNDTIEDVAKKLRQKAG